jgi:hypothetical protein
MSGSIDRLCDELRIRLHGMDRRLQALKANGSDLSDKSRALIESQLDSVEQRLADRHRTGEGDALEPRARPSIDGWPSGIMGDVPPGDPQARAQAAEHHALAAFKRASTALDEAAKAALEALLARLDATDDALGPPRGIGPEAPAIDVQGILDIADGHMHAAQAKWDRLTQADLAGIRTKSDLVAGVERRYALPHHQAVEDVESWVARHPAR